MISKEDLKLKINAGRIGLNKGLPHGLSRLIEFIPGIQQSTYYLVGAESGVGKSAFVNNCFIFNPIDWYLSNKNNTDIKLKIHYYSFEISKDIMLYKAVCRKIYVDYGILLDVNYILSRGRFRISDEHYQLVIQSLDYFDEMNDILYISDIPENPTGIWKRELNYAEQNGIGIKECQFIENNYVPKDFNLYTLIIVDHVSLIRKERGFTTKELIDKLSEYLIILRNKCGFTPVVIQQLNRQNSSADRFKLDRIEPQLSDFKDTGCTIQDSNICLSLFSPRRYELEIHRGYDIKTLQDRYRSLSILKNRDGESDKIIGLKFIGEVGYFEELKKVNEMNIEEYSIINKIKKSF